MKKCSVCELEKENIMFHKDICCKDGLHGHSKDCISRQTKKSIEGGKK